MGDPGTSYPNPDAYQTALGNALPPSNHELAQALLAPFGSGAPAFQNRQFIPKEQLDWNRKLAQQLMTPMQVHRPAEGFANVIRAGIGGAMEYQADTAAQGAQSAYTDALARVAGAARGDGGADGTPPAPSAPSDNSAAAPQGGFDSNVNRTLGFEGGYNPHDANGAPVNMGINAAANPDVDVAKLTSDQARQLYRERYWNPIGADNLSPALQRAAFDTSVIAGPGKAKELLAASGGDPNKLMDLREQFQNGLVQSDPAKFGRYADAWASRNAGLRSDIASLSSQGGAPGAAAPQAGPAAAAPPGAMAFTGPQGSPQGGMLSVAPPGSPQAAAPVDSRNATLAQALLNGAPPTQGPTPQNRALAHALIHGTPPQGPSPQDLAIVLGSPWGTPEGRAVASHMITPEVLTDTSGNQYGFRNGQQPFGLLPGARIQMVQIGGQNVPVSISGDPRNPTIRLLSPNDGAAGGGSPAPTGAATSPAGAPPAGSLPADRPTRVGPMAGYAPAIEQGIGISAQAAAAEKAGGASGDQYAKDRAIAGDFATSMYPLQQAAHALDALGPTNTGPGTEGLNRVKSILQSAGIPGFDASKIQNYDDARQFIAGYVGQHGGTDKLVGAFSGDPTANVSNAAASDLVKSALALNRMQQAKVLAFRQSGLPESRYSDFASDFASRADPRAYGIDQMSDAAKQKLFASMPQGSPERARFAESVRKAMQTGMINQPTR